MASLKIAASLLESVRKDPVAYGRLLAVGDDKRGGGTHGMFACVVDCVRDFHLNRITLTQAISELHSKFIRFKPTRENKERQDLLIEQMVAYLRLFKKMELKWIDGSHRIQWDITRNIMLTGLTPWVVADEKGYISYLMAEKSFSWDNQLRFPLYQQYMSDYTLSCQTDEIRLGFYFADKNAFEIRSFNPKDLKMAVDETGTIFTRLFNEYERRKK